MVKVRISQLGDENAYIALEERDGKIAWKAGYISSAQAAIHTDMTTEQARDLSDALNLLASSLER